MSKPRFSLGDWVRKTSGSNWHGRIVGTYSTELTPEGYCVESAYESGAVQIYPVGALELWGRTTLKTSECRECPDCGEIIKAGWLHGCS